MARATDWQMPRAQSACMQCNADVPAGSEYRSWLFERDGAYERRDCCLGCSPPDRDHALATWRRRRPPPHAEQRPAPLDAGALLALFQQLQQNDSPSEAQFRFVLALLLWRKRILKLTSADERRGVETWTFCGGNPPAKYAVTRPDLDEAQIVGLSDQLGALLAGGVTIKALTPAMSACQPQEAEHA